jgi:hypothetical protein
MLAQKVIFAESKCFLFILKFAQRPIPEQNKFITENIFFSVL